MISHIHHINFIVSDLELAVTRCGELLGLDDFIYDRLAARNADTARVQLGDTWLVFVQPTAEEGAPAQYLKEFGEGFFLISFGTNDIDTHLERVAAQGWDMSLSKKRNGLENWSVADLPTAAFFGSQFQLTQEMQETN